jgi:hypothetical protein
MFSAMNLMITKQFFGQTQHRSFPHIMPSDFIFNLLKVYVAAIPGNMDMLQNEAL